MLKWVQLPFFYVINNRKNIYKINPKKLENICNPYKNTGIYTIYQIATLEYVTIRALSAKTHLIKVAKL